ncbi:hypothetical protein BD413DRAFT_526834 [Trametes elegans]|nr:hypothetical protein BD413DRAFT_526834 [Trametes elegans]
MFDILSMKQNHSWGLFCFLQSAYEKVFEAKQLQLDTLGYSRNYHRDSIHETQLHLED